MKNQYSIDDITWNDLSMEQVYEKINTAHSSVGAEYLKQILRSTLTEEEQLKKRSARAEYFSAQPERRKRFQKIFRDLGKTKKLSLYDYIFRFQEIKPAGNGIHYLLILLLLAAVVIIFIQPVIGILALVVMFIINISTYFKFKSGIEGYFMCFKYVIRMLRAAGQICKEIPTWQRSEGYTGAETMTLQTESHAEEGQEITGIAALQELSAGLYRDITELSSLKRGSWLLTNSVSGSLIDVVMDYVRMLFHVDIIRFNSMRKLAVEKSEYIDHLFCTLGEVEAAVCISQYRDSLDHWCAPEFLTGTASFDEPVSKAGSGGCPDGLSIRAAGMYHPLTPTIVTNDMDVRRSVLLTGSNASGKSTFLKQVAINQIFAQTLYTCLADSWQTRFFRVLSSMALTDNILGSESYFIVEIKSLKRILNAAESTAGYQTPTDTTDDRRRTGEDDTEDYTGHIPVLCFIDEVLRGTNTKERVAASSQILKHLAHMPALCFAATHDIELTELLKEDMDNYHFEEMVKGDDVTFDYKIHSGPATSRNAIRLMQAYGFDPAITDAANALVDKL